MPPDPPDRTGNDALDRLPGAFGLPARFNSLTPTARLKALLALPDPGKVLRRLRPDEFFQVINSIGLEDALGLLPYGSSEQRKAYMDIDAWSGWKFQPRRLDRIIEVAGEVSSDFALRMLDDLDPEIIALRLLSATSEILTSDEIEARGLPDLGVVTTPDGSFNLICHEPDDVDVVRRWLDLLFARDIYEALRILHAIRRETPAALEDDAFRFRDARLQDLGFPGAADRFSVYEPFDVASLRKRLDEESETPRASRPANPPLALALATVDRRLFAWVALEALADSPALPSFVSELLYLVNRVMGARTDDWFDSDAWTESAAHVLRWISVGLENLSGGDHDRAASLAMHASPSEMFRTGIQTIRPAHIQARGVVALVGGPGNLHRFDGATAAMIHALAAFPPRVAEPNPPYLFNDPTGIGDVTRAQAVVLKAESVARFAVAALGFDTGGTPAGTGPSFASVVATAWARSVLTGSPSLDPLSGAELQSLRAMAFEGSKIRQALRRPTLSEGGPATPEALAVREFLGAALDRVEEALGGLDPSLPINPRFVGDCLIVRA